LRGVLKEKETIPSRTNFYARPSFLIINHYRNQGSHPIIGQININIKIIGHSNIKINGIIKIKGNIKSKFELTLGEWIMVNNGYSRIKEGLNE